jgi:hypothetical protein
MRHGAKVSVIIPALNEAASIGKVLDAIPEWADEVIVADNGSTDDTSRIAAARGARVVHAARRGYGSACLAGMAALDSPDLVVFLDADYSDHPEHMDRLVDPIAAGEADFVLGSRTLGACEPGAFAPQARWGDALACFLMRALWRARYTDLGPFRAIRYSVLRKFRMRDPDYGWTIEMQLKAVLHAVRVREVPVDYRRRIGRSKVSGSIRGVVGAGYKILSRIFLFALRHGVGATSARPASDRLIVFTRYPEPGATKTRLIPALGAEGAAELHRRLTEHTLRQARRYGAADVEVQWTGGDEGAMRAWLGPGTRLRKQSEDDLGARMAEAFRTAFDEGASRAVLVGCDSPDLGPESYEAAFEALDRYDVVVGPAVDGGYYLVGIRAAAPDAWRSSFAGIDWGTERVLAQTLARAQETGLSVALLAPLEDVDRPEDLAIWERHVSGQGPWLSVIIPTLEESGRLVDTLRALGNSNDVEVIVVDGGSEDATRAIARGHGARCFETPCGRAAQMNLGAAKAAGDTLLFLHADTRVPAGYLDDIRECLARPGAIAGAFRFATDLDTVSMRIVATSTAIRARFFQLPYGDQGLFLRKADFRRAGGFSAMPIMEDFDFVRRLRRLGRVEITHSAAVTRGDRWRRRGVWRTTARNALVVGLYWLGVSLTRLARIYRRGET